MHLPWSCFATISLVFVILVPTIAIGLQCYQCSTVENKDCDDPFRNHDYSPTECSTICVKIRFEGTVERGCLNNQSPFPVISPGGSGCVSQYIPMKGVTTVCRCSTPRCNGGVGNRSLVYLPFILSGLALVVLLVK